MQKKIIALAVAGLVSGAAFAQSNVTIYGIMDAGFYSFSGNSERSTGISSSNYSTSRLGFKGEEALGNGLKAVFNLETAVSLDDTSSGWGSNRQANVGLTGGFGTALVGVQGSLSDNWAGGPTEPMGNMSARNLTGNTLGRFSNEKAKGISYYSPVFSGLQLAALYGTKQETDTYLAGDQYYIQVGAKYANGGLLAAVTYANLLDDAKNADDWTVGVSYDFKVVKVFAGYERSADVGTGANTLGTPASVALSTTSAPYTKLTAAADPVRTQTNTQWTLGVRVPVGANGGIAASYAVNKNDADDTDVKAWQLGYDHNLSKRTTVYANYMHIANDDLAKVTPNSRWHNSSTFTSSTAAGEDYNGFVVGIRHMF